MTRPSKALGIFTDERRIEYRLSNDRFSRLTVSTDDPKRWISTPHTRHLRKHSGSSVVAPGKIRCGLETRNNGFGAWHRSVSSDLHQG